MDEKYVNYGYVCAKKLTLIFAPGDSMTQNVSNDDPSSNKSRQNHYHGDRIDWAHALRGVPSIDVLEFLDRDLSYAVSEAHGDLIYRFEADDFLVWEAVIRREQGLALSEQQRAQLGKLISFGDRPGSERVQYINELERPDAPWYEYVRRMAPLLLLDEIDTTAVGDDFNAQAWFELTDAMANHAQALELPVGVDDVWGVLDEKLRYRLDLQSLWLDTLVGRQPLAEETPDERAWRLADLIDGLRECIEAVAYFNLSIAGILERVTMPNDQADYLIEALTRELNIERDQLITDALDT